MAEVGVEVEDELLFYVFESFFILTSNSSLLFRVVHPFLLKLPPAKVTGGLATAVPFVVSPSFAMRAHVRIWSLRLLHYLSSLCRLTSLSIRLRIAVTAFDFTVMSSSAEMIETGRSARERLLSMDRESSFTNLVIIDCCVWIIVK